MRKIVITAVLIAASVPAHSEDTTPLITNGNGLNEICQKSDGFATGLCEGFIYGAAIAGEGFCPPRGVTLGQALDVAKNGLANHPEERQMASAVLLSKYFKRAWPCRPAR
jgi:hypothetical protein